MQSNGFSRRCCSSTRRSCSICLNKSDLKTEKDEEIKISKKALDNTFYSLSVYDDDKIIGYGRLIGDTICFIYIHDVMVIPEYQSKKIGTMIMNRLLEKINHLKKENPDLRVYLGASKNRESFYEKFGFIKRIDADLGYGMILISK